MKIKRERQVRLDELLQIVWSKGITNQKFLLHHPNKNEEYAYLFINGKGYCHFGNMEFFNKEHLFTITEEVEITEDTKLDVVVVYDEYSGNKNHIGRVFRTSIIQLKNLHSNGNIKFIYLQNDDGSIGELIWDKERGLVD